MLNLIFLLFWLFFYLFFQTHGLYGGDAGDLASAAYVGGVPHPPGFPLYTFLGYLLTKIPISTIAFRVGLLSSVFSALTLFILFLILKQIFNKNKIIPIISVSALGFTYPFWLFASVVEVYAMNTFFSVLLVYILLKWSVSKNIKYFYLFALILGIAFSHHQLILFLFPGFLYWIYINSKLFQKINIKHVSISLALFASGFLTYLYSYIAAKGIPLLSWNNPDNLRNLLRLFLKETYGVVYSGTEFTQRFSSRIVLIQAYIGYIIEDLTIIGFLLMIVGLVQQFITKNKLGLLFFILFLFSGPVLYFYSAFDLKGTFRLAIFEQFLSFSFIFLIYFITAGFGVLYKLLILLFKRLVPNISKSQVTTSLIFILFSLFPLSLLYINYPKISPIKNDFTIEYLAEDILGSVEDNSILFVNRDTLLFPTQFLNYTDPKYKNLKLFHLQRFLMAEFIPQIKKYYPQLKLPDNNNDLYADFLKLNYDKFPIYAVTPLNINFNDTFWIPYGFLYKLYKKEDLPSIEEAINKNKEILDKYHDPLSGSLGKYKNLYQVNILELYSDNYFNFSDFLYKGGDYQESLFYLNKAKRLIPSNANIYFRESLAFLALKDCDQAKSSIEKAISLNLANFNYQKTLGDIYKDCYNDETKAKKYFDVYEDKKKQTDTKLNSL